MVAGIRHYQKLLSKKRAEYLQKEKQKAGEMDTFKIFFPLLFPCQSLQLRTAEPSPVTFPRQLSTGREAFCLLCFWVCGAVGVRGTWSEDWSGVSGAIPEGW